jgi:hypothetical protein
MSVLLIYLLESLLFLEFGTPWLPTFCVHMGTMESITVFIVVPFVLIRGLYLCYLWVIMFHCNKSSVTCCRTVSLRLHPNKNLLAPNFRTYKQTDVNWVEPVLLPANNCHYLQHKGGIVAALSDCHHPNSLVSVISAWKNTRTTLISQTAMFSWSVVSVTWWLSCQFMVMFIRANKVFHLLHIIFITFINFLLPWP